MLIVDEEKSLIHLAFEIVIDYPPCLGKLPNPTDTIDPGESLADEADPEAPDDEDAEDDGEPNGEPDESMDEGQECSETEIEDDPEVEVDAKDWVAIKTFWVMG